MEAIIWRHVKLMEGLHIRRSQGTDLWIRGTGKSNFAPNLTHTVRSLPPAAYPIQTPSTNIDTTGLQHNAKEAYMLERRWIGKSLVIESLAI